MTTMEINEEQYTIDTTPFRVKIDEPEPGVNGNPLRKWNALKLNIDRHKTMWNGEYDDGVQVEYLYPQSNEKVWAVCIQCGKGRWIIYQQYCHLCFLCGSRSPERRKKSIESHLGEKNHMFGRTGENNPLFGKHLSEENRIKKSCANQGITVEKFTGFTTSGFYGKYCSKFNEALKERIREKYGRKCLLCPTTEEENLKEIGKKLSIHHVDYNKNCGCDGNECRLVPLCNKCHGKTNANRSHWEEVIMTKIVELFPDINFDSPQTYLEDFYTLPCESTSSLHTPTRSCICQATLF